MLETADVTEPIEEVIDFTDSEILFHIETNVEGGEQIFFDLVEITWIDTKIVLRAIGQVAVFRLLFKKVVPSVFFCESV